MNSTIPSDKGTASASAETDYLLYLADSALILSHRNSEWCGHGPVLEQDIALTNIALDLLGQARLFYQEAARRLGEGVTEDSLAYLRSEREYRNCLLAELENGDWGKTILKQFFFSNFQYYYFQSLSQSPDDSLSAIAAKSLKEVTYHLRWSSEWVIRLGDGSTESRQRMLRALEELWPYTGELFEPFAAEQSLRERGISPDLETVRKSWNSKLSEILAEATLPLPEPVYWQQGGKTGQHTEALGYILAEMQYLQRSYPGASW